jgi:hypothetical protein
MKEMEGRRGRDDERTTNKRDGKGIQDKGGEDIKIEIIVLFLVCIH